jgi:hypothetical protein
MDWMPEQFSLAFHIASKTAFVSEIWLQWRPGKLSGGCAECQ